MTITITREEFLGIVAQTVQKEYGITPDSIDLVELYADHSGYGTVSADVVVRAVVKR